MSPATALPRSAGRWPAGRPSALRAGWVASLGLALSAVAVAQTPYKVVAPDGKVTYTDRPVAAQPGVQVQALKRDAMSGGAAAGPPLPAELRAVQARFPVIVYTTAECASCDSGRRLLQTRGVPYSERLVASEDDVAALQRLSGGRTLPVLTVGGQTLRGFSETDWLATLDLAGYPKESRLPRGWQAPAAEPLVARTPVVVPRAADEARAPTEPAFPQATPDPSGIRF
jgi:glutaredoxin